MIRNSGDLAAPRPKVLCVQDGARLHYAIPKVLSSLGWLERVFTDFFVRPGSIDLVIAEFGSLKGGIEATRMRERRCPEIEKRVKSFPLQSLWWRRRRRKFENTEDYYEWLSGMTARWLLRQDLGGANMMHGFVRNLDPGFCAAIQKRGLRTVGDQMIAPAMIEAREMATQRERWPGWEEALPSENHRLIVVEKTWEHLDHITCASEYVREGLVRCGVARERISVLPYPAPERMVSGPRRTGTASKLRVGFVGSVNLRKGAPAFLEMARRIKSATIEFVMVGPVSVSAAAQSDLRRYVTLVGPVPRSQVGAQLQSFDIFLFPSVCEGSAGVVMEALNAGLPVVTTPNSGTVVRHKVEGFIHVPDDLDGMEASLRLLLEDKELRNVQGEAARLRAVEHDLASYQGGLRELLPAILVRDTPLGTGAIRR